MWDLPRSGLDPVSPALADGFLTTVPPGMPRIFLLERFSRVISNDPTTTDEFIVNTKTKHYQMSPLVRSTYFQYDIQRFSEDFDFFFLQLQ